jgi:hypothetical protein
MRRSLGVLDDIRIASPCPVAWERMAGDDRVRHCPQCDQPVYDLSALTAAEAEALVLGDRRACVRVYRRADGAVITRDCPARQAIRVRRLGRRAMLAVASWLGFSLLAGCREEPQCSQGKPFIPRATERQGAADRDDPGEH